MVVSLRFKLVDSRCLYIGFYVGWVGWVLGLFSNLIQPIVGLVRFFKSSIRITPD
jgi:hypothetical protein